MLYILYKGGLKWVDRYQLQQHANLSEQDVVALENMELLHARVNKVDPQPAESVALLTYAFRIRTAVSRS